MRPVLFAALLALPGLSRAFEPFQVEDIRVEGLRRIAAGTVFNYLPVQVGERLDAQDAASALRQLYATGFFQDVTLTRDGNVLVVNVEERPAVARIDIRGNDSIDTEELLKSLKDVGLAEGRVFDRALLQRIEVELRKQYFSRGQYGTEITPTVSPLPRNRVAVRIDVEEGEPAKIVDLHFVGNDAVEDDELKDLFELGPTRWYHFFSSRDEYSREKLAADLDRLRSYYQDRGYANFAVTSTQVSMTPDRQRIFLTVNIAEGEQFRIGEVALAGDLIVPEGELRELIPLQPGELYSRAEITAAAQALQERLGEEGYAFANVNPVPEVDQEGRVVDLTYFVDPGKRVYVRRINITGNNRTQDEVIRRELRQMEASWLSTAQLRRSRERLERLGFFERVNIETPQVPGTTDQVDVNVNVEERLSGSFQIGAGYGETQGVMLSASVHQDNLLGTGDRLSAQVNTSDSNTIYSISHTERFHTLSGISRTLSASYRETDAAEANLADYSVDSAAAGIAYGIPLNEEDRINVGLAYEGLDLELQPDATTRLEDWVQEYGNSFDMLKLNLSWARDTRNRAIFPTRGGVQTVGLETTVPGSDLEFYKLTYSHKRFWPLADDLTLGLEAGIGYGGGYGDTGDLPFFENFYAGGVSSVRGFEGSSLGPTDPEDDDDPTGGNLRLVGTAQLIFPIPFTEVESVRMSTFLDGGYVYDTQASADVDLGELRYSTGVGLTWLSPLGALTVAIAHPLNAQEDDETETFQFSLGTLF